MRPETILAGLALFAAFAAVVLLVAFLHAVRNRRSLSAVVALLGAACAALVGVLAATILVGTRGYRALTRETTAAWIRTVPGPDRSFVAHFRLPDGSVEAFELSGDEIYVDAHILKWKPVANLLGLHTAYELDRVAGRFRDLESERSRERTIHSLATPKRLDVFHLRRASGLLTPLVDAEYGSASFVTARDTAVWELRVSTTGLLLRPAGAEGTR
ncbi:MAG: hypothetical protein R6X22_02215 [Gemmatimonadota bacterium]